ncbi:BRO-N domain-containing protein [Pectobacterium aquaticum]|uniref:BRO-N domain-containing protein n=1 Tax=Pectobacterium aquaticum TaxID=2204145 RepID=UPI000E245641|nr:BRO family protein [Pectobacterium aquaticum]UEM40972.1 antirepressor protein [Pectobacterium aquaticum]
MTSKNNDLNGQGFAHPKNGQSDIFSVGEQDISVIKFEGAKVRVVNISGEPWFVAKDVCQALEIADHKVPLRRLGEHEKVGYSVPTLAGMQKMATVSESGFYKLIARSRKASVEGTAAYRFSEWVFGEVIPSIRKTGSYGVPWAFLHDFTQRKQSYLKQASKKGRDLQACKQQKQRLNTEEEQLWREYQPALPLAGGSDHD